jgi:hypothetical protein
MPIAYPIRFLENEIPQIYIEALSLTGSSVPNPKPYTFLTEAATAAVADQLVEQGFTVQGIDSLSFRTDADAHELQFCSLLRQRLA